jgi:hypothetical protein
VGKNRRPPQSCVSIMTAERWDEERGGDFLAAISCCGLVLSVSQQQMGELDGILDVHFLENLGPV